MNLFLHVVANITNDDVISCTDTYEEDFFTARYSGADAATLIAVRDTPNIWICQVSPNFFKPPFDEREPRLIAEMLPLFGSVITTVSDELIGAVEDIYTRLARTNVSLCEEGTLISFLEAHLGQDVFLIDWVK